MHFPNLSWRKKRGETKSVRKKIGEEKKIKIGSINFASHSIDGDDDEGEGKVAEGKENKYYKEVEMNQRAEMTDRKKVKPK